MRRAAQRRGRWPFDVGGTERTVEGSHLLVAAGRTPNTDGLGLELAGVETGVRDAIITHPTLLEGLVVLFSAAPTVHANAEVA